jgi:hypothetical protein
MRYALRKQDKIASVYSESYLKDHKWAYIEDIIPNMEE